MAPFVLKFKGNKTFSPLSQISDAETLTRTWKVCTKVASHLEQGQRLENLSWRLWFLQIALVQADNAKQKREFKRFNKGMSDKLDKDKGRQIHELEAPNFKRTDGTDKVRLRVEEMAQHRENGTVPANPNSRNGEANYMKGMQYTFAVDPRVKPITIKEEPGAMNTAVGGRGMMGKMRVRPMPPPPVPASAQAQQPQGGQDRNGDTTMHHNENNGPANNSLPNDHAMDVSEDEGNVNMQDHDDVLHEDDEFNGHHTPTPKRTPLHRDLSNHNLNAHGSHHPSSLPYPPHQTHDAHLLSNALVNPPGSNAQYATPPAPTAAATHVQSNIIRFPTIFASDFGPTSLLCALPTSFSNGGISGGGPSFHFEGPNTFHSFASLGSSDDEGPQTSTVTTQGIYGPSSGPTATRGVTMSGIGVGMQNTDTSFDFGVPRPTFEFPLEEMMKAEFGSSNTTNNNNPGSNASGNANSGDGMDELTIWDANSINLSLSAHAQLSASLANMNAGETGLWGVQPSEINPSAANNNGSNNGTTNGNVTNNNVNGNAGNKTRQAPSATPPARSNSTYSNTSAGALSPTIKTTNTTPGQAVNRKRGASISVLSSAFAETSPINGNAPGSAGSPTNAATSPASASPGTGNSGGPGSVYISGGAGSVMPGNVGNTAPGGVKSECANCGATHTPLWRRGLNDELNCNACGLYCKLHKRARPKNLRTSHGDRAGTAWGSKAGEADMAGDPVQCHNCATMATPLWRKDDEGNTLCNACGLYLKLHGTRRPLSMKSDVIRKRSRHETEKRTSVSSIITVMTPTGSNNPQNSRRNSPTPPPSAGSISSDPEPFVGPAIGPNNVDTMSFPFGQEYFGSDNDYLSGMGMGMGSDLTSFSSFGSYNVFGSDSNSSNGGMGSTNGLASPTSPTEVQHIVETTVLAGVENGGGQTAPNAKRRRMTLESNFSGSSFAQTSGGANSAHSSPTGLGQQPSNNSPSYFLLDANQSSNNVSGSGNNVNNNGNLDGNASPTRSTFSTSSPSQNYGTTNGVTVDFYGYPIHPPMAPLHPPSLMHPHSLMWNESPLQHTPTQSSMSHARSHSQSHSHTRSPNHARRHSHSLSHSRSNSQHITMPLYLYDGGVSSRVYETGNASTPTASGITSTNSGEDDLFGANFPSDLFSDHPNSMEDGVSHLHYGPSSGI